MTPCDVLLLGDYFCDIVITGLSEIPRLGADVFGDSMEIAPGGAYILAAALQRLGVKVCWAGRFGDDLFSRFLLEESRREGLDPCLFEHIPAPFRSMSLSFSFARDRGFISYTDPLPETAVIQDLVLNQAPRWVVGAPFDGSAESLNLMNFIHEHGARVFSDCQYTTATLDDPGLIRMLSAVDIFAPNLSEACQLTGAVDAESAARILARHCPLVVVKCGAQGAVARSGEQVWRAPALPVTVVDTTGAGDCFNAGFLSAHLQGEPIQTCLRYGNICGGLSVTRRGGAGAAPTLEQLRDYL